MSGEPAARPAGSSGDDAPGGATFTSPRAWDDGPADCMVIMCSEHRFREPTLDLLQHLGYRNPHVVAVPSGVAIAHSLTAVLGFLSKAMTALLSKAMELAEAPELVCVAHEDCGGYRAGGVKLIGDLTRRLQGKSMREIQLAHLVKAGRDLQYTLGRVRVRLFYASVVEGIGVEKRVAFEELSLERGRRRDRTPARRE